MTDNLPIPKFRRELVEDRRQDGYWIEAVNIASIMALTPISSDMEWV